MRANDKKIIILKRDDNSFEKFYSKALSFGNVSCYSPYKTHIHTNLDYICHVFMHFNLPFHSFFYGEWKKAILNADAVIIFDWIYSHEIINDIKRYNPNCRVIFWFWNVIEPRMQKKMLSDYNECYWTFDNSDAIKYSIHLNTQFYAASRENIRNYRIENNGTEFLKYDAFFCGKDKNRASKISYLNKLFKNNNIYFKYFIIADDTSNNSDLSYSHKDLEYEQIVDYIKMSKCIIDLTNPKQTGLTVRTLEALFYNKLLITDNRSIIEAPFYDKQYVYILDHDKRSVTDFIRGSLPQYEDKYKVYYSVDSWIERFDI